MDSWAGMDIEQLAAALGIDYDPARKEEYDENIRRAEEETKQMLERETPAESMARYEANAIEEMLRDGISSLGVAQLAYDSGFTSDQALHFITLMGVGMRPPGPHRPQPGLR